MPLLELLLRYPHLLLLEGLLPHEGLLQRPFEAPNVLQLRQPCQLLQPDPVLQELFLLCLKLLTPLYFREGCCFLLLPYSLFVCKDLLGFDSKFLKESCFLENFFLFRDYFLA